MIFVTGGSGLIGSFLISTLLEQGYAVKALYRNQIPSQVAGTDRVQWIEGDILDPVFLRNALQDVEYVFHCAGLVSYAPQDKELLKQINIEGTANVVDACLEQGKVKLCHVSSIAAIGRPKGVNILTESDKWDASADHSAYASSKYLGELEVWRGIAEGLKAVIVNPSVVLGPSDWSRSSTQLFKYVFNERRFYTQGSANFVDVRDVVESMVKLTFSDVSNERFILNAEQASYKYFFKLVADCFHKKAPSIKVFPAMAEIVWRFERIRTWVTGGRPLITKDTARVSNKNHLFSNGKVVKAIGLRFRPLPESVAWVCEILNTQRVKADEYR
jgi:dihydroflavonol-4-reductase